MSILEVNHIKKIYKTRMGGDEVTALRDVHFSVEPGEFVAIMGESGSGKTTLLNILASLDTPTAGKVLVDGKDFTTLKDNERAIFRRSNLGFIFQDFNLLDNFSIEDNIKLPLVLAGEDYKKMDAKVEKAARQLGIVELLKKYPYEVSGGQKQRTAIARALITNPRILLVGSSARRIFGRLTSARASATRCCSPPDNSLGNDLYFSASPTSVRISGTRFLITRFGLSITRCANATFSYTFLSFNSRKS